MKVGQIFDLPMPLKLGHIGEVRDKETQTRRLARYEVIEVDGELKGRIMVTYENRRRKK